MGEVYRARVTSLRREVAVNVLPARLGNRTEAIRWVREALASLPKEEKALRARFEADLARYGGVHP